MKTILEEGKKESEGKLTYELDFEFITAMAKRMSHNKSKYEPYNWMKPMDKEGLKQAIFRHTVELMKGNLSDECGEFGHIEALATNAMMLWRQFHISNEKQYPVNNENSTDIFFEPFVSEDIPEVEFEEKMFCGGTKGDSVSVGNHQTDLPKVGQWRKHTDPSHSKFLVYVEDVGGSICSGWDCNGKPFMSEYTCILRTVPFFVMNPINTVEQLIKELQDNNY